MSRTQTMVQLTAELVEELDSEAERRRMSRSALIRMAVQAELATSRDRRDAEQVLAGYRRLPPATPDAWGDLEAAGDAAATEVAQRLDAEEGSGW